MIETAWSAGDDDSGAGVVVSSVCRFLGVGIGGVLVGVGVTEWVVAVG